jgi:hypothetical protein
MTETDASDYVDAALEVLGGEDTEFYLTAQDASASGAFGRATVRLSCRYQGCDWGLFVGEMELWEFVTDARAHWEDKHAPAEGLAAADPDAKPS